MITKITSKSNAKLMHFGKLKQKKYRDSYNEALLEGERLVYDAIARGANIVAIILTEEYADRHIADCNAGAFDIYILPAVLYDNLAMTENSQGIIAVVRFEKRIFEMPKSNFLILDKISDPGNFGTIIRSALAVGVCDIYCINCVDYRNEKVLRSTMGAIFGVRIYEIDYQIAEKIMSGYQTFVADMCGENIMAVEKPTGIYGIVVGNEANGVSDEIRPLATGSVCIPMRNNVESLNVAVATAVIMYILDNKGD